MIIKKFTGKNEEEAAKSARQELGSNVVIMNVRSIKKGGIFGFLKPPICEVTVALEEENEREVLQEKAREKSNENVREALSEINRVVARNGVNANGDVRENVSAGNADKTFKNQPKTGGSTGIQGAAAAGENTGSIKDQISGGTGAGSAIEEKLDSLQNLLEQQIEKKPTAVSSNGQTDDNKLTAQQTGDKKEENPELLKFMRLLYNTMIGNEVNELYANQIIDEITKFQKPDVPFDYALAEVYQKMILKFGQSSGITPAIQGPKVVFFIGPTGVGKTTTIAKIASKFSAIDKKKVALLTADTYRIAAAEQLRTYADILEVPCRVIYSEEEVEQALRDFKDYDYIMVDTAGHSHQNEKQRENMNSIIHSADGLAEKEVYLVLSATTKYRDLISIADTYSKLTDYKLIFTKLDETTTLGSLLNLRLYTGAAISYVTDGQNVPDDISEFSPQKTVKLLLGGRASE